MPSKNSDNSIELLLFISNTLNSLSPIIPGKL